MEILSRDYGTVDIEESSIIRFDDGIIGFEDYREYVLLDDGKGQSPFRCLQSVQNRDLAFILLDPFNIKPDYEFVLDDELTERLSIDGREDLVVLAIVVIPDDVKMMSFNLKAPIIINAAAKKGAQQIVDNGEYGVRHYVFDEIERARRMGLYEGQTAV